MGSYHNMSAPPRTTVTLKGGAVSSRVVVFSLNFALVLGGHVRGIRPVATDPLAGALEIHDEVCSVALGGGLTPDHLFARIGAPVFPKVDADFLIGWRPSKGDSVLDPLVCTDPRLCAGVLSKCAGNLYLSRREPRFDWDQLLRAPIAFDDPLLSIA